MTWLTLHQDGTRQSLQLDKRQLITTAGLDLPMRDMRLLDPAMQAFETVAQLLVRLPPAWLLPAAAGCLPGVVAAVLLPHAKRQGSRPAYACLGAPADARIGNSPRTHTPRRHRTHHPRRRCATTRSSCPWSLCAA
jgi:hypothetical protein